ncbi:MAG: hypothetical protein ACE37K_04590 [Planctomycetota bacterium]
MQIPQFWAEHRLEGKIEPTRSGGRKRVRVVRRFGWSDESQAQAEVHARERAEAAFAELRAGRSVSQRERKLAYGDEGLPIREEVLARNGDDVITRNSYGARCLNEPDVLFADLDIQPQLPFGIGSTLGAVGCFLPVVGLLAGVSLMWNGELRIGLAALAGGFVVGIVLLAALGRLNRSTPVIAATQVRVRRRVAQVLERRRDWRFALYETPAGFRLLALHATFDPRSEEVQALFRELGTDPAYAQMCALQACFRARVSAKPWRIDLDRLPTRAVWPVPADRLPERTAWIARYELLAQNHAACRYLEDLGTAPVAARCAHVQQMHDELCKARTELPLA